MQALCQTETWLPNWDSLFLWHMIMEMRTYFTIHVSNPNNLLKACWQRSSAQLFMPLNLQVHSAFQSTASSLAHLRLFFTQTQRLCSIPLWVSNRPTKKRLLIDLCVLRQSYEIHELTEIVWIQGSQNPADAIKQANPMDALCSLVKTNKVTVDAKTWIERPWEKLRKLKTPRNASCTVLPK